MQGRWHPPPVYHLRPRGGWMNDPCAPGYDATTGIYHLFYQWNPKKCDWGDITWGHYRSRDGLHWTHNGTEPVLTPSEPYDKCGIFTGCFHPSGPRGERDQLTVFYTSVCHLPIHWSIPYVRNCEGLCMAVSRDGGRTWLKSELNPILVGEPNGLTVTGWRDPYVTEWPALDKARAVPKSLYGMISGGVLKEGPALFLYTVQPNDLSQWNYLGPLKLAFQGQSSSEQTRWSGNLGINWECGNVMTLGDNSKEYNFLLVGTEGGLRPGRNEDGGDPYGSWFVWMAGDLTQGESGPRMNVEMQGILDHGVFYAANSYQHPLTDMRVVWGWIKEDSLNLNRREVKGWAGFQALPREVFLYSLHNVTATLKTQFEDISSLTVKQETGESTKTVYTLGIRPLPGTEALRREVSTTYDNITSTSAQVIYLMPCKSTSFELEAVINLSATSNQRVGFHLRHNKDLSRRLTIYFDLRDEKIVFDQSQTNEESDIPKDPLCGPFTLFKQRRVDGKQQPEEDLERLRLRIFGDGDVFEIFANDRFALSGVAYLQSDYTGISCFVEGSGDDTVVFESIRIWDDMVNNSAAPG